MTDRPVVLDILAKALDLASDAPGNAFLRNIAEACVETLDCPRATAWWSRDEIASHERKGASNHDGQDPAAVDEGARRISEAREQREGTFVRFDSGTDSFAICVSDETPAVLGVRIHRDSAGPATSNADNLGRAWSDWRLVFLAAHHHREALGAAADRVRVAADRAAHAEIAVQVRHLTGQTEGAPDVPPLAVRLQKAAEILASIRGRLSGISDPVLSARTQRLAVHVVRWAHNLVFGTGRDDREVEEDPDAWEAQACVRVAALAVAPVLSRDRGEGLARFAEMLEMTAPPKEHELVTPLDVLTLWTRLHHQCVRAAEGQSQPTEAWDMAVCATRRIRGRILHDLFHADTSLLRNWLRLAFAFELLGDDTSRPAAPSCFGTSGGWDGEDAHGWRRRENLAYLLRESLRFAEGVQWRSRDGYFVAAVMENARSGRGIDEALADPDLVPAPTDYPWDHLFQPAPLLDALVQLVEHHAAEVLEIPPSLDLRALLTEVGRFSGAEGYLFAVGHLQHVLECYLVMQFVGKLEVIREGSSRTLLDILAGGGARAASPSARRRLHQTLALSALFHDVGVVLFPAYAPPGASLHRDDPALRDGMSQLGGRLADAGRDLVARCREELAPLELVRMDEAALRAWIERQARTGRPDHGVLGAWYLARISHERDDLPRDALHLALRAVLLHAAPMQVIDAERDPSAALLVLCDEILDWDPAGRRAPGRLAAGRSPQAMAVDLTPHRIRAHRLTIHGFEKELREDGSAMFFLRLPSRDDPKAKSGEANWPLIHLHLTPPEELGLHAWQVWMTTAQNIRRIRASAAGFGPAVRVHCPKGARARKLPSRTLLERTLHRSRVTIRGELQAWLRAADSGGRCCSTDCEHMTFRSEARPVSIRDVRDFLDELALVAEEVFRDALLLRRAASPAR